MQNRDRARMIYEWFREWVPADSFTGEPVTVSFSLLPFFADLEARLRARLPGVAPPSAAERDTCFWQPIPEEIRCRSPPMMTLILLTLLVGSGICAWHFLSHSSQQSSDTLPTSRAPPSTPYINGMDWLPTTSSGRSLWCTILGSRGSGKSLTYFKEQIWSDLLTGIPQFILDPVGSSDYILDKVIRAAAWMNEDAWNALVDRIYILDFSGSEGYVPPFPLVYRHPGESHYEASQRFLDTAVALDPNLASAAVEGENALRLTGTMVAVLCSILRLQLTEAELLLDDPGLFEDFGLFDEALRRSPEAEPAVQWFRGPYMRWREDFRLRRTSSYRNKLAILQLDPVSRAIFGSQLPYQWWLDREAEGACVIALFDGIRDQQRKLFTMMTVYDAFISYKLSRGLRSPAWSLVLEELSTWIPPGAAGEVMASKFASLANVYARNYQCYVTSIVQELFLVSPMMQQILLAAGNLMIGNQESVEGRLLLAQTLFPIDGRPLPPKRWDPIYAGEEVIDARPVDWQATELLAVRSNAFRMPPFHFLVRAASEGDTMSFGGLKPMVVTRNLGEFVQKEQVAALRRHVIEKSGRPIEEALAEIDNRIPQLIARIQTA